MNFLKYLINNIKVYSKFGFRLPKGTIISNVKNIRIGNNLKISPNCFLFAQGKPGDAQIILGDNVGMNYNVMLNADCGGLIKLGDNISIGPYTVMRASNHNFTDITIPIKEQGHIAGIIKIQNNVWIGAHVVILPNVTIGHSSIIGAGSIVTKDIPAYSIVAGNPAKIIKSRK